MELQTGSTVEWIVRGKHHSGSVVEIVEPGQRPTTYSDSYGVPGPALKRRYVVNENGKLYYPSHSTRMQAATVSNLT